MNFREAVEATPEPVDSAYRRGKGALKREHKRQVQCEDSRNLTGSIDLDGCLRNDQKHSSASRWDYGLGYRAGNCEIALWIEVHAATTGEVNTVLKKLHWLKEWLTNDAPQLEALTNHAAQLSLKRFYWLATKSGVHIRAGTPQDRRLRAAGLDPPRPVLKLS